MMKKLGPIALLLLIACNGTTGGAADSQSAESNEKPADIAGTVTHIEGDHLRVEATPEEFRGDKAVIAVTDDTTIRDAAGRTLSLADLRKGQRVRVWFTGAVAKSYPLQATADRIVVD